MYPAVIDTYHAPTSVQEALQAFANGGSHSFFLAGGQSLMQAIKARVVSPKSLIDLQHVAELKGIQFTNGAARIGAMTRYRDIAADEGLDGAYQALRDAASHVGDRQVRNRGTIGGQPLLELHRSVYAADLHRHRRIRGSSKQQGEANSACGRVSAESTRDLAS
jgi:aerobic carbon-monoxide dehydrogenase medium subunit